MIDTVLRHVPTPYRQRPPIAIYAEGDALYGVIANASVMTRVAGHMLTVFNVIEVKGRSWILFIRFIVDCEGEVRRVDGVGGEVAVATFGDAVTVDDGHGSVC